jgi:L-amino acid N-acyltransferase YncA
MKKQALNAVLIEPMTDGQADAVNIASLRLHRSAGFREFGVRERIALHHGRWRDVVLIERRSRAI